MCPPRGGGGGRAVPRRPAGMGGGAGELVRTAAGAVACAVLPPGAAGLAVLALALAGRRARAREACAGEPQPVTLTWRALQLRVGRNGEKVVLEGCAGSAGPGQLTAVLGPSGAGKVGPAPPPAFPARQSLHPAIPGSRVTRRALCENTPSLQSPA